MNNSQKTQLRQFFSDTFSLPIKTIKDTYYALGVNNANDAYKVLDKEYKKFNTIISSEEKRIKKQQAVKKAQDQVKVFLQQNTEKVKQKQEKNKELIDDKLYRKYIYEYNHQIANTPFVVTTISDQISTKFQLGEYSIQTAHIRFIEYILSKLKLKLKNKNVTIFDTTAEQLFKNIYNKLIMHSGQLNRIFITSRETGKVISSKLKDNFEYKDFSEIVRKIVQSSGLETIGELTFTIQYRNLPSGGASVEVPQFLSKKRGVSIIINDDNLCGQRCLVLADCKTNDDLRTMKTEKAKSRFDKKTLEICNELGLKGKMQFTDFEVYANKRQVQVIIVAGLFVEMYATETEFTEQVYIYYDTAINHYHFIQDINSASNDSKCNNKWCKYCRKSIRRENFNNHKCKETVCGCCSTNFCSVIEKDKHFSDAKKNKTWIQCDDCNLWCPNDECLDKHQINKHSTFSDKQKKKCNECNKWVEWKHFDEHKCGEKFCRNCENYYSGEHRCFVTKIPYTKHYGLNINEDGSYTRVTVTDISNYYVYDFESKFDENNNHKVNLCIVKKLYNTEEEHVFYNIEDFVKFAVSTKNTTFIAHNGKAYDNWMVHKYIIKHTAHRPNKLILAGNKIMYMKVKSIRFIDSLNHIAQGLATFPKTFGLKEIKKGFFPYLFNTDENQNYIGCIPDKKYFNTYSMTCDKLNEFNIWYETQKNIRYDFKKELYEYCNSDVDILKRSLEIYIADALKCNGIHPLRFSTIASYCLAVFRTNFMTDKQIAVLTKEEYDFCKQGFFGGRTEVFKLFQTWTEQDIKEGKYGKYVDIQSLYPSVQFFDELPCGIPKWDNEPTYTNADDYINSHYGYIQCDITCPQNLHVPLLPEKRNNKLMFDLIDKTKKVYSSVELKKAIEVGYIITKIHRSLSFEKTDNIFKGYIQNFLKIKTESAGYDDDDIDEYITRYYQNCGVLLEKDKIKKNKGMKLLAKICLNSLWGKFGQNDELPTTAYIKNDAWFRLLKRHVDKKVELKNEVLIDDDTLYVSYIEKEEAQTCLMTTNLGLAGFVTANARLRLYKELYKLDDRVIYCDTDSIIYEYRKDKYNVTEGDCLGEWELEEDEDENEVKHPGNLQEIYALAPKTYGYKTITGLEKYKCKGITLSSGNKTHFTYDTLKELIKGERKQIVTYSDDFIKDNKTGNIYTKMNVEKVTNYNADEFKRTFFTDGTSTPLKNI